MTSAEKIFKSRILRVYEERCRDCITVRWIHPGSRQDDIDIADLMLVTRSDIVYEITLKSEKQYTTRMIKSRVGGVTYSHHHDITQQFLDEITELLLTARRL